MSALSSRGGAVVTSVSFSSVATSNRASSAASSSESSTAVSPSNSESLAKSSDSDSAYLTTLAAEARLGVFLDRGERGSIAAVFLGVALGDLTGVDLGLVLRKAAGGRVATCNAPGRPPGSCADSRRTGGD